MYRYIELSFGYVEEGSMAHVLFYNNIKGFDRKEDALLDLALDLQELYERPRESTWAVKDCCKAAVAESVKYCPGCGRQLRHELSKEKFSEWIRRELLGGIADGSPDFDGGSDWWPWDGLEFIVKRTGEFALTSESLISVECAERVLANLAYDGLDSDWKSFYHVE